MNFNLLPNIHKGKRQNSSGSRKNKLILPLRKSNSSSFKKQLYTKIIKKKIINNVYLSLLETFNNRNLPDFNTFIKETELEHKKKQEETILIKKKEHLNILEDMKKKHHEEKTQILSNQRIALINMEKQIIGEKNKMEREVRSNTSVYGSYTNSNLKLHMKKIRSIYENRIKKKYMKYTKALIERHNQMLKDNISTCKKEMNNIIEKSNNVSNLSIQKIRNHYKNLNEYQISIFKEKTNNQLLHLQKLKSFINIEISKYNENIKIDKLKSKLKQNVILDREMLLFKQKKYTAQSLKINKNINFEKEFLQVCTQHKDNLKKKIEKTNSICNKINGEIHTQRKKLDLLKKNIKLTQIEEKNLLATEKEIEKLEERGRIDIIKRNLEIKRQKKIVSNQKELEKEKKEQHDTIKRKLEIEGQKKLLKIEKELGKEENKKLDRIILEVRERRQKEIFETQEKLREEEEELNRIIQDNDIIQDTGIIKKNIDMYNLNYLNSENFTTIKKNINNFDKIISKFKNILFICGDYPGYGGAATNCNKLQQYYKSKGHQVYGFYYNYERGLNAKYEQNEDYIIDDLDKINKVIFKPDLIILKSPCHLNFKKIFNCPVYYLIGGIYTNSLDKYYYDIKDKKEQDKYINICVINSIKKSTMAFTNSSHTKEILKRYYNLNTKIFYSSFVPFQNETPIIDKNFNNRKYDYGLIVSNFDRKIKNVDESIDFLKDKKNVILIGKNSNKYKDFGFECIDLVEPIEMKYYYKQIKYIVQDSFYESCSNVKIEGLFNGCKIHEKKLFIFSSTQLPGNGGAATNCLYLHEYVKNNLQHDSIAVFLTKANPSKDHIKKDIYILDLKKEQFSEFKYQILRKYNEKNIICLCKNVLAPQKMKQIFPLSKVIYLASGCPIHTYWANFDSNISFVKYKKNLINMEITEKDAKKEKMMVYFNNIQNERKSIQICDEILTNNNNTKEVLLHHYKDHINKICNISINTSNLKFDYPNISQEDFDKRDIDIIFAVSSHTRVSKGSAIMNKIITNNNMDNLTKVVIGNKFEKVFNVNNIKKCLFLNQLSQSELLSYLKRSKILIIPSTGDASPNILYEGLHVGCNILLTKNCGNYELFPDISVLEDVDDIDLFIKHIYLLKDHRIDYNIQNDRKIFNNYLDLNYKDMIMSQGAKSIEGLFNGCKLDTQYNGYNVVVCSTQYPGQGGAASVAYNYHKKLLDEGYNSKLYFFLKANEIEEILLDSNLYNPSSYKNVYYLSRNFHVKKEQYSDFNVANTIIAFNYGIIPIIKKQFSGELIYYVTGSPELTLGENSPVNNNISYENFMNESNYKYLLDNKSSQKNLINLELADKVVVSCEIVKNLYIKFYPQFSSKYIIEPFEKNIYEYKHKLVTDNNKILFNDREYFIICATSSWKRRVKNVELIYNIFKHFPDENKVIIGTQNDKYNFKDIPNTTVLDIISNNELHRFLCNSKNYILPSFFESASITLLEALHNGCNVITSKNVGLSYLIPENNIVDDFENLRSWTNCINTQSNNKCILFISYNIPGYGGASTNIYEMYQYIKNIGISTYVIFIEKKYDELKIDKEELDKDPNVFIVKKYDKQTEYSNIISVLSKFKDVRVIFKISKTINLIQNYLIPYINISYIVYLCSGLASVNSYINNNFNNQDTKPLEVDKFIDNISQQSLYSKYINIDLIPINASNITIFNSNHTYNIIKKLCKKNNFQIESNCKVINTSIAFKKKQNKTNKLFDLIFSSSSYTRHTKNSVLACKLFSHSRLISYKKLIIGKDFPDYIKKIPNLTYIDENVSHKDFINFLNESKILFLPSFYDSMPNILYESICSDCIPFVSDTIECNSLLEHNFFSLYMTNDEILDKIYNLLNKPINQNNTQIFIDEQNHNRKTILEILKI